MAIYLLNQGSKRWGSSWPALYHRGLRELMGLFMAWNQGLPVSLRFNFRVGQLHLIQWSFRSTPLRRLQPSDSCNLPININCPYFKVSRSLYQFRSVTPQVGETWPLLSVPTTNLTQICAVLLNWVAYTMSRRILVYGGLSEYTRWLFRLDRLSAHSFSQFEPSYISRSKSPSRKCALASLHPNIKCRFPTSIYVSVLLCIPQLSCNKSSSIYY